MKSVADKQIDVTWVGWLIFMSMLVTMILTDTAIISINDDWGAWNFLQNGECRVLIMSVPMAQLLVWLYNMFPSGQWYSLMIFFAVLLSFANVMHALNRHSQTSLYKYAVAFALVFFGLLLMHLTISSLTVMLVLSAFLRERSLLFWFSISFALLLRIDAALVLLPVGVLLAWYLRRDDLLFYLKPKKYDILVILPVLIYAYHAFVLNTDSAYTKWSAFNDARGYFLDYKGLQYENHLSHDAVLMLNAGWLGDNKVLPSAELIENSESRWVALLNSLHQIHFNDEAILLLILIFPVILNRIKWHEALLYGLVLIYFIVLTNYRDVPRITMPLFFVIAMSVLIKALKIRKDKFGLLHIYAALVASVGIYISINNIPSIQIKERIKAGVQAELEYLTKAFPQHKYEVSIIFPMKLILMDIAMQDNPLFGEQNWISMRKYHLMCGGWMQRHPYWYKDHNITEGKTKGKFSNYMTMITDENSYFIGTKNTRTRIYEAQLIELINRQSQNDNCRFALSFETMPKLKYLELAKIRKTCSSNGEVK